VAGVAAVRVVVPEAIVVMESALDVARSPAYASNIGFGCLKGACGRLFWYFLATSSFPLPFFPLHYGSKRGFGPFFFCYAYENSQYCHHRSR
jgi:hypothetical protein